MDVETSEYAADDKIHFTPGDVSDEQGEFHLPRYSFLFMVSHLYHKRFRHESSQLLIMLYSLRDNSKQI